MILTVHDELLFEVPREEADELAALVRDTMEAPRSCRAADRRRGHRRELEGREKLACHAEAVEGTGAPDHGEGGG